MAATAAAMRLAGVAATLAGLARVPAIGGFAGAVRTLDAGAVAGVRRTCMTRSAVAAITTLVAAVGSVAIALTRRLETVVEDVRHRRAVGRATAGRARLAIAMFRRR